MTNLPQFPLPKATLLPVGKFGKFCHICKILSPCLPFAKGPSCLVICIDLLVAGEVGEIVKIAGKEMQSLVANFDNFTNFVEAGIFGHKWIWVKTEAS